MYNIIFLTIALLLFVWIFYIVFTNYNKKSKKEGFTIGDNNNLSTSALTDTDAYIDNLGSIINNIKGELNIEAKREQYTKILKFQSELIKLCMLKKFLNLNLNWPDDYIVSLSQQTIFALNSNYKTGADIVLEEVLDTSGAPNVGSSSGGVFTNMLGLNG